MSLTLKTPPEAVGLTSLTWTWRGTAGSMPVNKCIVPKLTLKRGAVFEPEWGPHPWGWLPEEA